jgi:hypothetical protein
MKKTYQKPNSEAVNFCPIQLLTDSLDVLNDSLSDESLQLGEGEILSRENFSHGKVWDNWDF